MKCYLFTPLLIIVSLLTAHAAALDGEVFVAAGTSGTNALPSSRTTNTTVLLNSTANATTEAFVFDTSVYHTSGTLVEFYNLGTNAVSIGPQGGVYIASGLDYSGITPTDLIVGLHSVDRGDDDDWNVLFGSVENSSFANAISQWYVVGGVDGDGTSAETYTEALNSDQSKTAAWRNFAALAGNSYFRFSNQSATYLDLKPDASSDPYTFNSVAGVTGNILRVQKDGSDSFTVNSDGKATALQGFSSTATDAAVTIAATGWTNTFAKNAVVYMDSVAGITYTVFNNVGTAIYTNATVALNGTVILQPSGKVLITGGTLGVGRATPF
jgi:hypothetical protein